MTDPAGNGVGFVYDPVFNFLPQQVIRYPGGTPVSTNFTYYGNATNVVVMTGASRKPIWRLACPSGRFGPGVPPMRPRTTWRTMGMVSSTETIRYPGTGDPNVDEHVFLQ